MSSSINQYQLTITVNLFLRPSARYFIPRHLVKLISGGLLFSSCLLLDSGSL